MQRHVYAVLLEARRRGRHNTRRPKRQDYRRRPQTERRVPQSAETSAAAERSFSRFIEGRECLITYRWSFPSSNGEVI